MERATLGSLSRLLYEKGQVLTESQCFKLCSDTTSGLLALHRAGVIHGDVKSENVLIFTSRQKDSDYVAKISDFGSAILVGDQNSQPVDPQDTEKNKKSIEASKFRRYHGTPTTNAPEVADQTSSKKLDITGMKKCDNYSLGLLILQVVVGHLDSKSEAKTPNVVLHALDLIEVEERGMSEKAKEKYRFALEKLLQFDPKERCADLAIIEYILHPPDVADLCSHRTGAVKTSQFRDSTLESDMKSTFKLVDYLKIYMDIEFESERDTQALVFDRLLKASQSKNKVESGKALFQLAIAHACGYGTSYNEDSALKNAVASARKGYLPAQASVVAFHVALGREKELDHEEKIDWLFEAAAWGSYIATECLARISLDHFYDARKAFHRAGGYNQFFYAQEPPPYLHSEEFLKSIPSENKDLEVLARNAAIYGDLALLQRLLGDFKVDPNLVNDMGESLVLFCCKAGHLELLKVCYYS